MGRTVKFIGGFFLVGIIALVFLSKTIYSYNMPSVTAGNITNGRIRKTESSSGVVAWSKTEDLYSTVSGKVEEILVEENERLQKGQIIARLSFDEDSIISQIESLKTDREKALMNLDSVYVKIARSQKDLADLQNQVFERAEVTDDEINTAQEKLKKAQDTYDNAVITYNAGASTLKDKNDAETAVATAEKDLQKAIDNKAKNETKADDDLKTKEDNRAKSVDDKKYEISNYEQDVKSKLIDLETNAKKIADYERQLAEHDTDQYILAEEDCTVISLNIKKGQNINSNQLVGSFGIGDSLILECDISIDNNFTAVDDDCTISNSNHSYRLKVAKITSKDNKKVVTFNITTDEIAVGETFSISFRKDSAQNYQLVPNGAINQDSSGYYVYAIKTRDGILGKEYYIQKQQIYTGDSDGSNTVVTQGLNFMEPIVTLTDKAVSNGQTVKVSNEGDFFVN